MLNLNHGSTIRLAAWNAFAIVGTIQSYCSPRFAAMARARGDAEAWASYAGAAITDHRSYYIKHKADVASAIIVEHGQVVEIEGNRYSVKVMRGCLPSPQFSDPIHFIPVKG